MVFIVKDKATGQVHEVIKYLTSTAGEQCVWSITWPGRHIIGQDCEWANVSKTAWERITFIRNNPDLSVNQLAKKIGISYTRVFRMVDYYHLPVRREKSERKSKPGGKAGKFFNPNKRGNWMV